MKRIVLLIIVVIGMGFWLSIVRPWNANEQTTNRQDSSTTTEEKVQPAPQTSNQTFDRSQYSIDKPTSLWIVANKQRPLPAGYVPDNLISVDVAKANKPADELMLRRDTADALQKLFKGAKRSDLELMLGSGYRSYETQSFYYNNYVKNYGAAAASRFSAKPGTSEHQTGLAADVSGISGTCYLEICFKNQPEGKWIANNAHRYGFIIRYPEGKEDITGYQYEPWHLRYVGVELAKRIYGQDTTMEQFFDLD